MRWFRILLGRFGIEFCPVCGDRLICDDEKFELGYKARSVCKRHKGEK